MHINDVVIRTEIDGETVKTVDTREAVLRALTAYREQVLLGVDDIYNPENHDDLILLQFAIDDLKDAKTS
jgi:hypothetical protein